ncbi:hypothetical protein [Sphingobium yanoikuyae]|uniref:hypothetical protein n=1 Tax=Sphingobium yanoikuyae TaxID=13690 RepID=UPI0035C675A7
MAEWIEHHGRGYPFELTDAQGEALPQPDVLVRIRALDRGTVEAKGNWMPATKWKEWRWAKTGSGAGDIIEYQRKG